MSTIQHSIDVRAPVHQVFEQLTRFEDYPRFMEDVDTVQRIDANHLHWTADMAGRSMEWDAEITRLDADRCIAWCTTGGPVRAGTVELQPLGTDAARITVTMQDDQEPPLDQFILETRLQHNLARLKNMLEGWGVRPADAAAGARLSGSKGTLGPTLRGQTGGGGSPGTASGTTEGDRVNPAAGAGDAGVGPRKAS